MKAHVVLGAMSMLVALTIGALCFAGEQPTIEGTYKLISRQLPDGTMAKTATDHGALDLYQESS
jgi:hypothetical protein